MENNKLLSKKEELKKLEEELALMQEKSGVTSETIKKLGGNLEKLKIEIENEKVARSVKNMPEKEDTSIRNDILGKNEVENIKVEKTKEEAEKVFLETKKTDGQKTAENEDKRMEREIKDEKTDEENNVTWELEDGSILGAKDEKKLTEMKETWTEEDEKTLSELLKFIENTKREIDEIKKEIEKRKSKKEELKVNTKVKTEDNKEKENMDSFDIKHIEHIILELFGTVKQISIEKLSVRGNGEKLILNGSLKAKKIFNVKIKDVLIENGSEGIELEKNYLEKIEANGWVKERLVESTDSIAKEISNVISKEKNRKVEKIWIEGGQLKVKYKK